MARVVVDEKFCKGCGLCVANCPKHIMALDMDVITTKGYHLAYCSKQGMCTGCASCATMCPDASITVYR